MTPPLCARCGQPAAGLATISNQRYCHEDEGDTCYMLAQRDLFTDLVLPALAGDTAPFIEHYRKAWPRRCDCGQPDCRIGGGDVAQ